MSAFSIGQFIGGLLGFALLFLIVRWVAKRWLNGTALVVVSGTVAMVIATILRGFGAADGGSPDFGLAFKTYVIQAIIITASALYRATRTAKVQV